MLLTSMKNIVTADFIFTVLYSNGFFSEKQKSESYFLISENINERNKYLITLLPDKLSELKSIIDVVR